MTEFRGRGRGGEAHGASPVRERAARWRHASPCLAGIAVLGLGFGAAAGACGGDETSSGTGASSSGGSGTGGHVAAGGQSNGGGGVGGSGEGGLHPGAPPMSPYIVVDQFGYRTGSAKLAIARDPEQGSDAGESFTPATSYSLVRAGTGETVATGPTVAWNGGATDSSSGDRAWRYDFSSVTAPGSYYVLDGDNGVRSPVFRIAGDVYRGVLRAAVRTFFYQRAGQEKTAALAGAAWVDGASHLGPLQDSHCRRWDAPGDAATERDLRGGWYDAGDYNKYTSWTARYVVSLLRAYAEAPSAFGDDYDLPESGNGVPDVLDEAKWGLDYLVRLQNANGSVLSIVGVDHASPPSAATGPSLYGAESTSATLATAAAFALGAEVLASESGLSAYASDLATRAGQAWSWADANPNVLFYNNDGGSGTSGLGAGQQETDAYGRQTWKLEAAVYLFAATGQAAYRQWVDANYDAVHLMQWSFAYPFEGDQQSMLLYYAALPGATANVANDIRTTYLGAMQTGDNFAAIASDADPYLAHLADYVWGSNHTKSAQGNMYADLVAFSVPGADVVAASAAAERYAHYLHGVNPLGIVYLSNMGALGAEHSVTQLYHSWFADGSPLWDSVGGSTYGPAPGFLTGGPNPSYSLDGCCPNGCGSPQNNAVCTSESLTPPMGQPDQKSYKDFNTSWPLNSWEVTENSDGYQVAYIRLLSKLVD